ncbi:MAG: hypothetical protein DHS20C11_24380 [Lysobacteraceae bacterium]|nr:MAG: hypothetical protein DHS20C11_24380 [Xanthomonadaceae bacterium]
MLETGEQRNLEIARELFNSALEAFQWTSTGGFEFGAHKRDHGWEPRKESERLGWYLGFIDLLRPALCAPESTLRNFAKSLLANNFRGLWSFGGCFDVLEEITHKHAIGGSWPELWVSIKQTINFDGKHHSEALLKRLKKLEHISAPADFVSEIEAYAFANTWDHVDAQFGSYGDQKGNIYTKIIGLGEKAATVPDLLDNLGVRFWNTQVDGLGIFGEGLAKGSPDPESTFEHLLSLMQKRKLSEVQPILLEGFIRQVYLADPSLARKLQERSLEITELKPHSVYFLAATPIAPWATQRLLQLARDAEIETWRFEQIKYGRVHETISDSDLTALLLELNKQEEGLFTTIGILGMRFLPRKSDQYVPDENLRAVGRAAILKLLSMHRSEIRQHERIHELELVLDQCICDTAPTNEIRSLVNSLCDGIQSYRLYGFELANVISTLTKRFPEVLLNHIFSGKYEEKFLLDSLFRLRLNRTPSALNSVSFKRLIKWCGGDQSRILKLSASVSPYTFVEKETGESVEPNEVQLSDHIKAFLEVSNEKAQIMETILENSSPSSWSGSRATMMRTRSIAFSELLEHSSAEIRKLAAAKLELLNDYIQRVAARETDQDSLREQRFE